MDNKDFYLSVAHALSDCQVVEQQLKLYITEALELVKKCVGDRLPFYMTGLDYENSSLENLIKTFNKFTDNKELVAELNRFKEDRNYLSHKGITHCLDHDGEIDTIAAAEFAQRLSKIAAISSLLYDAIHDEADKFRAHLYFDNLDECKYPQRPCVLQKPE